ncbi:hypothetical protein SLS56_001865 [Neofusicoccum ribis]|uniref:Zn(2)-C6 fungal-type domain-containing protein n=1 Tax=Neofusicoccum ribis TaxID=45134 RepID=A0ABR3T6A9_9PEZI
MSGQRRKRPNGILAVACLACQKRKTKCATCSSKSSPCLYDAPEGQTRIAALKQRNADLQARLASSAAFLWRLKTLPPDEAAQTLERIRTCDDPSALLDSPDSDGPNPKRSRSPDSADLPADQPPPAKRQRDMQIASGDPLHLSSPDCSSAFSILKSPEIRDAFHYFLKCTGVLFHVFTKEQGNAALDDVLRSEDSAIPKVSMCEVCAIAAVGVQYSQGRIPVQTGEHFYNIAKYFLDDVVEFDPLRGMKICALFGMYNIVVKGSVALAFIVATLGYSTRDDWMEKVVASRDTLLESDSSPTEHVQMEMCLIAIIKAKIFQTTFTFSKISKGAIESIRADLRRWYEELDPSMQLAQLSEQTGDVRFRRGIYLVHCLHLGAMILVQRRIFQQYVPTMRTDPQLADRIVRDLSDSIEEGFTASITCARILDLVHADDGIFQRCWLCIFQSYISTVEILFVTAQKLLHGYPKVQVLPDLNVARGSLAVLKFCATVDHVAKDFARSIQKQYDYIISITHDEDSSIEQMYSFSPPRVAMVSQSSLPWEFLLKLPPGDSQLHQTSRELMEQLCNPFANMKRIDDKEGPLTSYSIPMPLTSAEEITLGGHLDYSRELGISTCEGLGSTVDQEIILNLKTGFFINSTEPCGWSFGGSCLGSRQGPEMSV